MIQLREARKKLIEAISKSLDAGMKFRSDILNRFVKRATLENMKRQDKKLEKLSLKDFEGHKELVGILGWVKVEKAAWKSDTMDILKGAFLNEQEIDEYFPSAHERQRISVRGCRMTSKSVWLD